MKENCIQVTQYSNLKDFLNAYVQHCKSNNPQWSLSQWARDLGLEATSSLTMILNGKRNIGPNIEKSLIDYFLFTEKELHHLQMLIKNDKINDHDPLKKIIQSEISLTTKSKPIIKLTEQQWAKINNWYFIAIRQLARIIPIQKNNQFLKSIIPTDSDINFESAVDTLVEHGFLKIKNDKFIAEDVILSTTQNISSDSIKNHHEQMGTLAVKAVRKYDINLRDFQSCTFSLNRNKLNEAHDLIEKFIHDFETLVDSHKLSDSVYQLNIQLFPLAVLNENNTSNH